MHIGWGTRCFVFFFAMIAILLKFVVGALTFSVSLAVTCSLPDCPKNSTCYATTADAMDCLESIPFNIEWATATVDVISQSLENYGFLSLFHSTGPPYVISLDIMAELNSTQQMIDSGAFSTDMDFQEHIQDLIQITQDAHTRYQKPVCYTAVFLQPFAFDVRVLEVDQPSGAVQNAPKAYLMRNSYTDKYEEMFGSSVGDLIDSGLEVQLLDGLEFTSAISAWGDSHETRSNNRGIRFNAAVRSYLYRSAIQYSVRPIADLTLTMSDGQTYTFPWMAIYTTGLANLTYCAALPPEEAARRLGESAAPEPPLVDSRHHPKLLDPVAPFARGPLHDERPDRTEILPSDSPFAISCFTQKVTGSDASTADVFTVLVMKVSSFAPGPESNYTIAWNGFMNDVETCLSAHYDMMVVDVMQNGGGYVCLGLRLLELLVEDYFDNHTLVQMNYDLPHSPLMDQYIAAVNAPDPVDDETGGILDKTTQLPFPDGEAYYYGRTVTMGGVTADRSNYFSLDCRQAEALPSSGFRPTRWMTPGKLLLLTDGTCGSTCACFTKIPQEHGKATLVGVGGLWDEGMDVSSFAGGFVSNAEEMASIANASGISGFPTFLTNQHWQFDWAIWYSSKYPSRPAQFTEQQPDYREAFWGFPHPSIDAAVTTAMVSSLYDRVIASSVSRLAASASAEEVHTVYHCDEDMMTTQTGYTLMTLSALMATAILVLITWMFHYPPPHRGSSLNRSDYDKVYSTNPVASKQLSGDVF